MRGQQLLEPDRNDVAWYDQVPQGQPTGVAGGGPIGHAPPSLERPYPTTMRFRPVATPRPASRPGLLACFAVLSFLLFTHPFPLNLVPDPRTLTDAYGAEPSWVESVRPVYEGIDGYTVELRAAEETAIDWTASRAFGLELPPQESGASDPLRSQVRLLLVVALALAGALLWSLVGSAARGRSSLGPWLHLVGRYVLALTMLRQGIAAFFAAAPLGSPGLAPGDMPGACAALAGLCLCFRRTSTLGAVVATGVLLPAALSQLGPAAVVDVHASRLLFLALLLCLPDAGRLADVLLLNRPTRPRDLRRPDFTAVGHVARILLVAPFVALNVQLALVDELGATGRGEVEEASTLPSGPDAVEETVPPGDAAERR